jgi:transposase
MNTQPLIPNELWDTVPPAAQAALLAVFESLRCRIGQLEREVEELKNQVAELTARLNQNSSNSSKPPSSDPPSVKRAPPRRLTGKKRGGQRGHKRHRRDLVPPEKVTASLDIKPETCRRCGTALLGDDSDPLRHQVAELPPIEPVVTEYRLHRLVCEECGENTCGQLPTEVPRGAFGPRLQSVLSLLAGAYRLGKRPIQSLARDLFGLTVSTGMICKLEQATSETLAVPVEELREYIRNQDAGADETSWRENRGKAWLWVAVTKAVTVFTIATSRGAKVIREMLGEGYNRVLTSDRWTAYTWLKFRQLCWSHLRRDFQAMIDRANGGSETGKTLLELSDQLFHWWHRVRDGTLPRSTFQMYVEPLRSAVHEQLKSGAASSCKKTAGTCRKLLEQESSLWTFVWIEGIEPTNNEPERTLRHAVLWRKSSGGTDSEAGSRFVERMLSVVATCRQQNRNVLEFLTACCAARLDGSVSPSLRPVELERVAA